MVSRVSGPEELSALLGALIEEKAIRRIVRWDTPTLSHLDNDLTSAGAEVLPINLNADESSRSPGNGMPLFRRIWGSRKWTTLSRTSGPW